MAHDVFVSHSSKDKLIADGICANLEAAGVRCWIAPRDIAPGEDWPRAIANAISQCHVMVLIFSANANSSDQISRELSVAAEYNLVIIPFKIENVKPEPGKQYYLSRTHWLDAMNPPTQEQINLLVERVKSIIPKAGSGKLETAALPAPEPKAASLKPEPQVRELKQHGAAVKRPAFPRRTLTAIGLIALGISLFAVFFKPLSALPGKLFTTSRPSVPLSFTPTRTPTDAPTVTPTSTPNPTATPDMRVLNPANQHQYLYVSYQGKNWIGKTWHKARDHCSSLGGHLVTIQDEAENTFIHGIADTSFWLGAKDMVNEGYWVWVTGEPWTYTNWASGEPNGYKSENYLVFGGSENHPFSWNDSRDGTLEYVCEWESTSP